MFFLLFSVSKTNSFQTRKWPRLTIGDAYVPTNVIVYAQGHLTEITSPSCMTLLRRFIIDSFILLWIYYGSPSNNHSVSDIERPKPTWLHVVNTITTVRVQRDTCSAITQIFIVFTYIICTHQYSCVWWCVKPLDLWSSFTRKKTVHYFGSIRIIIDAILNKL